MEKENLPTPAPTPSRATYGFAIYLASYAVFKLFLVWAFLPNKLLDFAGFSFLPQKYWVVAIPVHLCVTIITVAFIFYPAVNLMLVPAMNDISLITDKYADYKKQNIPPGAIPRMTDIPIHQVCETLFLYKDQ